MKILVIVPAYNEGKAIYNVVTSILREKIHGLNVLVVNDGSLDNTKQEAERAGAKVINLPINLGIGGAVQTGYLYAYYNNYDIAIQFDGDGQHRAADLRRIIDPIKKNKCDMVIGSRFVEISEYKPSFFRSVGIKFFSSLVSRLCNEKVYDTTSGYRAINSKVIESFVNYYPKDYPEVETIAYLIKNGFKVEEIPVVMNYRTEGVSSITPIKSIYYMIKVTLALLILPRTSIN
ncbi:glycosyltransferase family 2 protein [Clostridium hydrogeniformans]|uniref:glycosyltransferase family 2 protein n=1 Tax=Clostridium hydrogeniformans TaxID=349933 RepID=UPI000481BFD2|nr:glycosyltransferase family 2 protein [Clostridium hydrogeniformans]